MTGRRLSAALVAVTIGLVPVSLAGDWKSRAVQKAVGKAAREGLEEVAKDAAKDAALDAALDGAVSATTRHVAEKALEFDTDDVKDVLEESADAAERSAKKVDRSHVIGRGAAEGLEAAMKVADMADTLDDVADTTKTVNRINKVRRLIK